MVVRLSVRMSIGIRQAQRMLDIDMLNVSPTVLAHILSMHMPMSPIGEAEAPQEHCEDGKISPHRGRIA